MAQGLWVILLIRDALTRWAHLGLATVSSVQKFLVVLIAFALASAACTDGGETDSLPQSNEDAGVDGENLEFEELPTVPEAEAEAHSAENYEFTALSSGAGGFVTGFDSNADGSVKLAKTDVGGVYAWRPDGRRWDQLLSIDGVEDPDPLDWNVESMAIAPSDPDRLYLSIGNSFKEPTGRVLSSIDGGATWTRSPQPFVVAGNADWRTSGERLAVDPSDPDVVLLGTRTEGLWRSTDGAVSFVQDRLRSGRIAPRVREQS